MNHVADFEHVATDGEIAVINLESARRGSWQRFHTDSRRDGVAEAIVEQEAWALQILGDLEALDRMTIAAEELARVDGASGRTALVQTQVASAAHRFADARRHLEQARLRGAPAAQVERQALNIDQACGTNLDGVLDARRRKAATTSRLEDLVPLGSLLAEIQRCDEADAVYRRALDAYDDVSPFPLAWTCFQRGLLWGEVAGSPDPGRAATWYRRAIEYLPQYVRARVHLAEIHTEGGHLAEAEALLAPVLSSGDPEVSWRLADVAQASGDAEEAAMHLAAARSGFEALLAKHPLAFADHGAEFYLGSGDEPARALALAKLNLANRRTARAFELYADAADRCGGSACPIAEHS